MLSGKMRLCLRVLHTCPNIAAPTVVGNCIFYCFKQCQTAETRENETRKVFCNIALSVNFHPVFRGVRVPACRLMRSLT